MDECKHLGQVSVSLELNTITQEFLFRSLYKGKMA